MAQLDKVDCSRGAPMGRRSVGDVNDCADGTISLFKVRLNGDYDDGGAYWGGYPAKDLYCARFDSHYVAFARAYSRHEAAGMLGIRAERLRTGRKDGL
jgi:hypothetical protein